MNIKCLPIKRIWKNMSIYICVYVYIIVERTLTIIEGGLGEVA